jgi:hypothetical protein
MANTPKAARKTAKSLKTVVRISEKGGNLTSGQKTSLTKAANKVKKVTPPPRKSTPMNTPEPAAQGYKDPAAKKRADMYAKPKSNTPPTKMMPKKKLK